MGVVDPDASGGSGFVLSGHHEPAEEMWHTNPQARLIVASEAVVALHTEAGRWVAPPGCAVWVVPGVLHRVTSTAGAALRVLYVNASADPDADALGAATVPADCCVIAIDALADALLSEAAGFGAGYVSGGHESRTVCALLDHLAGLPVMPLSLIWPRDPRTRHIADTLTVNPAEADVLDELAVAAGVTARTAARLFIKETGVTFGQWRQQLRLLEALERLGGGASVHQVALEVGYHDVSSFIAVFRQALGETPARYFR
ncbi:MAG TPA: helix-turn-helix transcriptional regulator [Paraburkholderia sp.]|nr:helix-turn-helix transcriptional regulator [Paraburkholderia sp.]